jgi:hypothetical protein
MEEEPVLTGEEMTTDSPRSGVTRSLLTGAVAGLLFGWLLPMLLGPPIASWAPSLRDSPRLSDAVVGAGGFLVYISEAPTMYLAEHLTTAIPAEAAINAVAWTFIGLIVGALVVAIRRSRLLAAGALGGLLGGWIIPALCQTLGECFRHCWMHEGLLGDIALAGGTLLRGVGVLAELPWRLMAGPPEAVTSLLAIPVSAAVWTVVGGLCAAGVRALQKTLPQNTADHPEAEEA